MSGAEIVCAAVALVLVVAAFWSFQRKWGARRKAGVPVNRVCPSCGAPADKCVCLGL